jgi:hypothetical protein
MVVTFPYAATYPCLYSLHTARGQKSPTWCLDEELIGIARQRADFFDIPIMISDVDHAILVWSLTTKRPHAALLKMQASRP